jgi:hypothetical protein
MKKLIAFVVIFCMLIGNKIINVRADTPMPQVPWEYYFDDANFVFFITPQKWDRGWREDDERMHIRTGLYYNTTPPENIYYLDAYFNRGSVYFSNDGLYVVYVMQGVGEGPGHSDADALKFYSGGNLTANYPLNTLVYELDNAVPRFTSHIRWLAGREFDSRANTLAITTVDNRVYVFDITTGEIINQNPFAEYGLLSNILHRISIFFSLYDN